MNANNFQEEFNQHDFDDWAKDNHYHLTHAGVVRVSQT